MAKLTYYNIAIALVVASGGFSYGFAASSLPASIGQPGFYEYYALDPDSLRKSSTHLDLGSLPLDCALTQRVIDTANVLSATNALFFFGCANGAISQCWLADWLGRKKALAVAGILALIGSALVAGSVVIPMLIVVRILQGAGVGMLLCLVVLYLTEVSPPHVRGFLTGLSTLSFGLGYVVYVVTAVQP